MVVCADARTAKEGSSIWVYDRDHETLSAPSLGITLRLFDKLTVDLSIDQSSPYRPRLAIDIIDPPVPKVERKVKGTVTALPPPSKEEENTVAEADVVDMMIDSETPVKRQHSEEAQ